MREKGLIGLVVRFIVSALVLMLISAIIPGFAKLTFGQALSAAIAIAIIGFVVEMLFGKGATPQRRGIIGFVTAVVIIFISQFFVAGMSVSLFGALLAALVIGLIDRFVPTGLR